MTWPGSPPPPPPRQAHPCPAPKLQAEGRDFQVAADAGRCRGLSSEIPIRGVGEKDREIQRERNKARTQRGSYAASKKADGEAAEQIRYLIQYLSIVKEEKMKLELKTLYWHWKEHTQAKHTTKRCTRNSKKYSVF